MKSQGAWFRPSGADLRRLGPEYSNTAIANARGVSEQTVRTWLAKDGLVREGRASLSGRPTPRPGCG